MPYSTTGAGADFSWALWMTWGRNWSLNKANILLEKGMGLSPEQEPNDMPCSSLFTPRLLWYMSLTKICSSTRYYLHHFSKQGHFNTSFSSRGQVFFLWSDGTPLSLAILVSVLDSKWVFPLRMSPFSCLPWHIWGSLWEGLSTGNCSF